MVRPAALPVLSRRRTWFGAVLMLATAVAFVAGSAGVSLRPGHADLSGAAEARGQAAARRRAGPDARSRRGDQLRLHQRARLGRRQRATLLRHLDARSRPGDLRPEDQAPACARQCPPEPGRRHGHPWRDHGSERRLSRRLRGFAAYRRTRADPLRRHARRTLERQLHHLPQRHLHGLRGVQGRSHEAAEMAGEGGADHPRSKREDAVFRGRAPRISRRPAGLSPVFLGARSDREAQERRAGADLQHEHGLRLRGHGPLLLGAGAELRRDHHADDHDQAGPAAAGRVPPSPRQRRLHRSCVGHLPARQGRFRPERHRDAGLPRLARQPGNVGPVQSLGQMDLGLGRDAAVGQDLHAGLRPLQSRTVRQPAQVDPGLRLVPDLPLGTRRPQLLRRAHAILSTASPRPTIRSRSRSSIP